MESEIDMHKVVVAFDVDAPEYAQALAQVEQWLVERREGNALAVWAEGCVSVSTLPQLPHYTITVECEKRVIYLTNEAKLNAPKTKKPAVPKNKVLDKFNRMSGQVDTDTWDNEGGRPVNPDHEAMVEDLGGMDIAVEEFAPGSFDHATDDDIEMGED